MKRKKTRRVKEEVTLSAKETFFQRVEEYESYERPQSPPRLEPRNQHQRLALSYLNCKSVVFLTGSAGTGKSLLAAWKGADLLKRKKINKLYLVRPAVSVGESVGMLPGDIKEKLAPYFAQTMSHLQKFLGNGFMTYCLEKEIIEMKPVEYLRGMSFENCMVIAEEVQNFTAAEMEMMLTRLGDGCNIVFTGDTRQHDLMGKSGLEVTLSLLDRVQASQPGYLSREDIDELDSQIGVVRFTPFDVIRSGITRAFVKVYYHTNDDYTTEGT